MMIMRYFGYKVAVFVAFCCIVFLSGSTYGACPAGRTLVNYNTDGTEACEPSKKIIDNATKGLPEADEEANDPGKVPTNTNTVEKSIYSDTDLATLKSLCEDYSDSPACDEYKRLLKETKLPSGRQDCKGDKICEQNQKQLKCREIYGKNYCQCKYELKGIYLNTEVPFIGAPGNPRCLVTSTSAGAGVTVLQSLTKILMTFVLIGGFGMIVRGGVQIAAGDVGGGKEKILGVVIAFALLGSLGVILRFINPNFFS